MGVRKNAKFLTPAEREAFVQACVLMKADIVNPGAAPADQYSRWDEDVAIHRFIQNANTPANNNVNFGHGGLGAYGFLSWHRYFLYRLEQQLQTYVPGVMLPYWDWTDPVGRSSSRISWDRTAIRFRATRCAWLLRGRGAGHGRKHDASAGLVAGRL